MHDGHRIRLKERFLKEGLDNFEPHQILELLLFFSIPRRDTNPIAHSLIDRYGSLSAVFDADPKDLASISGIGESTALLLTLIPSASRIYFKDRWRDRPQIDSSNKAGEYMISLFAGRSYEAFYLVSLDAQSRVNNATLVHEGTLNEAAVYPRKIVETALRHKANSVILSHNHPGGSLNPSKSDIDTTKKLCIALRSININVVDHIIVAGEKYTSFAERGILD